MREDGSSSASCCDEILNSCLRLLENQLECSQAQLWEKEEPSGRPVLLGEVGPPLFDERHPPSMEETARKLFECSARDPHSGPLVSSLKNLPAGDAIASRGLSSVLALPVEAEDRPRTLLVFYVATSVEIDRRKAGYLEAVAAHASITMKRICPARKLAVKAKRWEVLTRHLRSATSQGNLEGVATHLAGAAEELWGARLVLIWMVDEPTGSLQLVCTVGEAIGEAAGLMELKEPLAEELMKSTKLLVVEDLGRDPRWRNRTLSDTLGVQAMMGSSLLREGRPTGAMMLLCPSPDRFQLDDDPLLEVLAMHFMASWELWWLQKGLAESQGRLMKAEENEAKAQRTLDETHDVNNALGLILGNAHMLRSKLSSTEEALKALDIIEQAVGEASERVKRLQGLRVAVAGGPRVNRVDLNHAAEEALQLMRHKFKEALVEGVTIELKKDLGSGFQVLANPVLLREALLKVIISSAQGMPRGGSITLRTWEDQKRVHLSVSDAGAQAASTPGSQALGLRAGPGIASAQNLIKSQAGEVVIQSHEGMGTTVTITFPKAELASAGSLEQEEFTFGPPKTSPYR